MITVELDPVDGYLTYKRDGRWFYDAAIPDEDQVWQLLRHLGDKMWFPEVKARTIELISEYFGGAK